MEFNSEVIRLMEMIENSPQIMVFWSAFGTFFCLFPLFLLLYISRKLGVKKYLEKPAAILTGVILVSWIIGFVSQMILLFSGVSGLRMMLIWLIMFITYLAFGLFNTKMIMKWVNEKDPFKK